MIRTAAALGLVLFAIAVLVVTAGPASAETQLFAVHAGPYAVGVTADPSRQGDTTTLALTPWVRDRRAGRPVDDAAVTIEVTEPSGKTRPLGTRAIGNAYVTIVDQIDSPWWRWDITVTVEGDAGTAQTTYRPPTAPDRAPVLPFPALVAGAVGLAVFATVGARRLPSALARRVSALVGLGVVVAATAQGLATYPATPGPDSGADVAEGRDAILAGMCEAANATPEDPLTAQRVFYGQVHRPIHGLAADLQATRPGLAARLLEAKNWTETSLASQSSADVIDADLNLLLATVQQGLQALTGTSAACPTGTS